MLDRRRLLPLIFCFTLAVCADHPSPAAIPATPPVDRARHEVGALRFKTERVVVFKDGYALILKSAEGVVDGQGELHTDQVPEGATLGSFWAFAEGHPTLGMRAEWVEQAEVAPAKIGASSLAELLAANLGRVVSLELLPAAGLARAPIKGTLLEANPSLVVLETESGRRALLSSELVGISGAALETKVSPPSKAVRGKRLSFVFGASDRGKTERVHLLYFTEELRWIPTYRIFGKLEKEAQLELQGELLNEVEDLEDTAVDLVVGVPSFRFKSTPSPLTLEPLLRNALASAAPDLMGLGGQAFSNANFTPRAGEIRGALERSNAPLLPAELSGSSAEQDLYVYRLPAVRLKKGGRATLPLLSEAIAVRHLYTAKLSLASSNAEPSAHPVWHELELSNPGSVPWTTGPAMLLRGEVPLGQDLLGYTPGGGKTLLPITAAVEIRAELKQVELERKPNDLVWGGHAHAKLTERATLTLHNAKLEAVHLRITVELSGRVESSAKEGQAVSLGGRGVNPDSRITYDLLLGPNEKKSLSADVVVYVP